MQHDVDCCADLDSIGKHSVPSSRVSKITDPTASTPSTSPSSPSTRSSTRTKIRTNTNYSPISNLDAFSMQPFDGKFKQMYIGGSPSDDVSEPTVEGSFSDEDFSLSSEKSFLTTHGLHIPQISDDDNEDLSLSSINTKALLQITDLTKRLRIQENTKLELLNQCLHLEGRLEKNDCKHAFLRIYKTENNQLREASAKMERDFMNDMNDIVTKMAEMEEEYQEKLRLRDARIKDMEQELRLLKVAKNLDDVSTSISCSPSTLSSMTRNS